MLKHRKMVLFVCFKILVSVSCLPFTKIHAPELCPENSTFFKVSQNQNPHLVVGSDSLKSVGFSTVNLFSGTPQSWLFGLSTNATLSSCDVEYQKLQRAGTWVPKFRLSMAYSQEVLIGSGLKSHTVAYLESKREEEKRERGILGGKERNLMLIWWDRH